MPSKRGVLLTEELMGSSSAGCSGVQPPGDLVLSGAQGSRRQMSPWAWGLGLE